MVARERVAAVIAAAGASSRMGRPKALLDWGGVPLLQAQCEALRGFGQVIMVVREARGHRACWGAESLDIPPWVTAVVNPHPEEGRSRSFRCGFEAISGEVDAILCCGVDQPLAMPGTAAESPVPALLSAFDPAIHAYVRPIHYPDPSHPAHGGHPTVFAARLLPELLAIREEGEGLREVIAAHHAERLLVEVASPLPALDLNTPEDYAGALASLTAPKPGGTP